MEPAQEEQPVVVDVTSVYDGPLCGFAWYRDALHYFLQHKDHGRAARPPALRSQYADDESDDDSPLIDRPHTFLIFALCDAAARHCVLAMLKREELHGTHYSYWRPRGERKSRGYCRERDAVWRAWMAENPDDPAWPVFPLEGRYFAFNEMWMEGFAVVPVRLRALLDECAAVLDEKSRDDRTDDERGAAQ